MSDLVIERQSEEPRFASGLSLLSEWLWSRSIVAQTGQLFNFLAVFAVVVSTIAVFGTYRVEDRADRLAALTNIAFLTAKMNSDVVDAKDDFAAYRAANFDEDLLAQSVAHLRDAQETCLDLRRHVDMFGETYVPALMEIDAHLQESGSLMSDLAEMSSQDLANDAVFASRLSALEDARSGLQNLRNMAQLRTQVLSGTSLDHIQALLAALCLGLLGSIAIAMVGKRIVQNRLIAPIVEISEISERISRGENDLQIPGSDRHDEIGKLAQSLEVFRKVQTAAASRAMRELESQKTLEDERARQRSEKASLIETLALSFEENIGEVAQQVASASENVGSAARKLAVNVESSSQRVDFASNNLSEATHGMTSAAAASDEFALSISELSSQATVSSERARKAAEAARSADETIHEMIDSADKISHIVEVIASIAKRTNLLALNAAIEAARSAETGRGFAVVANEVKELAAQTHRETARVEELIVSMQNATGQSASALSTIAQEVIELQSASSAIASAVDQQANAGQDLARAIDMAANNTMQIGDSIADVSGMMSASKMTAEQLEDSSGHLNAQIGRLRKHVNEFLEQIRTA